MANLIPTLTLTSTNATSDELNFSVTDDLGVGNNIVSLSKISCGTSAANEILSAAAHASIGQELYLYIKNMDGTNYVEVKTAAGVAFARLRAEEFMFLPLKDGVGFEVQANTAACVIEYGYWGL